MRNGDYCLFLKNYIKFFIKIYSIYSQFKYQIQSQ